MRVLFFLSTVTLLAGTSVTTALKQNTNRNKAVAFLSSGSGASNSQKFTQSPACAGIECGVLSCPHEFQQLNEGTCCPVCFNENIDLSKASTGASGKHGGVESQFCKDVFCFPLLCPSEERIQSANGSNGQCCAICKE